MEIFIATHITDIHEGAVIILSLHKSPEGAEKAIKKSQGECLFENGEIYDWEHWEVLNLLLQD